MGFRSHFYKEMATEYRDDYHNRNVTVLLHNRGREGKGRDLFVMHRLVQLCMQAWVDMENKSETYQAEAVDVIKEIPKR